MVLKVYTYGARECVEVEVLFVKMPKIYPILVPALAFESGLAGRRIQFKPNGRIYTIERVLRGPPSHNSIRYLY